MQGTSRSISVAPVKPGTISDDRGELQRLQGVAPAGAARRTGPQPVGLGSVVVRGGAGSMRIWQRSARACTRAPPAAVIAQPEDEGGAGGVGSAARPMQSKARSVTCRPPPAHGRLRRARASKKPSIAAHASCAAVEALPVQPHQADQLVADVDRDQVALGPAVGPAQQQRLDVGFEQLRPWPGAAEHLAHASGGSCDSVAPAGLG